MKAGPVVIGQLLQNRYRYCVPIYQRHYVWNREKQWEPFWNDIRTKAIERLTGRERRFSHFMGAVVLESRGGFSARRVPSFQVVDGQQRLTTFQLFLAAARDYAASIGYTTAQENIKTYLLNRDPQLMETPDIEIYKVWPTQYDRELFTDIITLGGRDALREKYAIYFYVSRDKIYEYQTTPRPLGAYGYFYDQIKHAVETDELEDEFYEAPESNGATREEASSNGIPRELRLDAIWQSLVEEFKVVEITLEEGDDAQVIFETLNERGEPLLAADLVRNNIFQRADAAHEQAEKLFATYWKRFEDQFWEQPERQGRYKKPRIEFFLANYIAGQIADEVNLTKLFSEYKAFMKRRSFGSVANELKEINRFGRAYYELVGRSGASALTRFAGRLLPWEVTTVYPLVLRLWESGDISEDEKAECLDILLSFIVRRAVCGLTSKNYNKFFLSAIAYLDSKGWGRANLVDFLLAQKSETGRFPLDDEFERRWIGNPLYRMLTPGRTRSLLEELEKAKRTRFHETTSLSDQLTVEHVLPTQWEANWPLPDGAIPSDVQIEQSRFVTEEDDTPIGRIVRRNRLKDTIGNLTLLTQPLNSSVSNGPYEAKRRALQDHSLLVLNREIAHVPAWDEDAIVTRSKELFKLAASIWPLPAAEGSNGGGPA